MDQTTIDSQNTLDKSQVITLILSQLQSYGHNALATVLAEGLGIESLPSPSNRLSELCFLGTTSQPQDEPDIIESSSTFQNIQNNLEIDPKLSYSTLSPPDINLWYTSIHRGPCRVTTFSRDGRYAATGSSDMSVKVIDINKIHVTKISGTFEEKPVIKTLYDHQGPVNDVKFHPNGKLLASCSDDCSIKFFDLTRPNVKKGFRTLYDSNPVNALSFHPSGDFLLSGTQDSNIRLWDVHSIQCYHPFQKKEDMHIGSVNTVQYHPLGNYFASGGEDGSLKFWDALSGKCINTIVKSHSSRSVSSLVFSSNGRYLLTSGRDSVGRLWDMNTGKLVQKYEGATQQNHSTNMAFSQNEEFIFGADELTFSLLVWDTKTGDLVKKIPSAHNDVISCIATNYFDGGFFTCGADMKIKYWSKN